MQSMGYGAGLCLLEDDDSGVSSLVSRALTWQLFGDLYTRPL